MTHCEYNDVTIFFIILKWENECKRQEIVHAYNDTYIPRNFASKRLFDVLLMFFNPRT